MSNKKTNTGNPLKTNSKKQLPPKVYKVLLALTLVLTLIVFSNSLNNDFIVNWDDDSYILNNSTIQQFNKESIKEIFTTFYGGNYHPLTTLVYALEFKWFNLNPKSYHLINLLFHLFNVLLVFFFIKELTKKNIAAIITCVLFAIHPMHVESVAWISELKDVLYTFFFLLSMLFYIRFSHKNNFTLYFMSLMLYTLSLLSKSAAVVLPILLILIDYLQNKKIGIRNLLLKLPFFLLSVLFGIIALKSQGAQAQLLTPDYSLLNSFFVASYALSFYIFKFFIPLQLSAFYPHPIVNGSTLPLIYYLSPLLIAVFAFITYRVVKHRKTVLFGFIFLIVTLALILQFFPVGGAIVAERYTYVPYIGLAFILAIYFENIYAKLKNKQILLISVSTVAIVLFSVLSFNRTKVWANGITLFDDVIEKNPKAFYAYHSRGVAYFYAGNYTASLNDYNKAIELNNNYGLTFYNRGLTQMMLKNYTDAQTSFNRTIELIPTHDQAYNDRGIAAYNLGLLEDAIKDYSRSIELNPNNARAHYNRGVTNYRLNEMEKACYDLRIASQLGSKEALDMFGKYCKQ